MKIAGLQELTLIDYPGLLACTIFVYGCNFKCGFCHNPELVVYPCERTYSEKEILDFLDKKKKYLDGVCLTGGEPLLTLEKDFLIKIKEKGYLIKLDTNGSFPAKLKEFLDENLVDFVAMDIKSGKEKYSEVANTEINIENIEASIRIIINSGKDYEFRTTILEEFHDQEEIVEIGRWVNELVGQKPKKYVLQGFKNKGKFIDEIYQTKKDVSKKFLDKLEESARDYFENVGVRV